MSGPSRREVTLQILGVFASGRTQPLAAANLFPPAQRRQSLVPLTDEQGQVISRYEASSRYFSDDLGGGITLEMALIPGGTFSMGSISNVLVPPFNMTEQPVHEVSVKPFALGVYPVTIEQWRRVASLPQVARTMRQIFPTGLPAEVEAKLPADIISYEEAEEFFQRLRVYTGRAYRFPSEAEWEYACRAGTDTKYHFGDGISRQVANYNDGIFRPLGLTPVGSKQTPNRFGLHDMHGNVIEWCADWAHSTYDGGPTDGAAWTNAGDPFSRISRGGSFVFSADRARSSARRHSDVRETFSGAGFRVALDIPTGMLDPKIGGDAVTNAASGIAGPVSPGEIVTLRGSNIGPDNPTSAALDERGFVATELLGTRVLFDGVPAPLLYVSASQVNAVVPYEVSARGSTQLMVEVQGQTSAPLSMEVVQSSPALFTTNSSGQGQGAILNQDGTLNSTTNPATRGSIVSVYATGEGQTNPAGVNGKLAGSPLPSPILPVELLIDGVPAEIQYAGAAPGLVAGVLQVNALVPDSARTGEQAVVLRIGQTSSRPGVFVAIG